MSKERYSSRKRLAKAKNRGIPIDRLPLREVERMIEGRTRVALDNYLGGMTQKEALAGAGLSQASTGLFHKPLNQRYIGLRREAYIRKNRLTQEAVLNEYMKIAFFNVGEILEIDGNNDVRFNLARMTDDQSAALSELVIEEYVEGRGDRARKVKRVKFRPDSKQKALDSLSRHLGLFNDKVEVTGGLAARLQEGLLLAARSGALKVPEDVGEDPAGN